MWIPLEDASAGGSLLRNRPACQSPPRPCRKPDPPARQRICHGWVAHKVGAGTFGWQAQSMPRAASGRWGSARETRVNDRLGQLTRAFQSSIYYGTAVRAYSRTVDHEILPSLIADMPDLHQWEQESPRAFLDGSASFGGPYAVTGHVGTGTRTSALDPYTAEVQRMAGNLNRFAGANALLGLLRPGPYQGPLSPEGDNIACVLEDYIRDILDAHGVFLDRVFCDRPTWRRIMGSAAGSRRRHGGALPLDACVTAQLPGLPGVKLTALPGKSGLLHLKSTSGMQYTDGGAMMGIKPDATGSRIALVAYKEFVSTSTMKRSSASGATWTIRPPEGDAAEPADQGGLPPRRSTAQGVLDMVQQGHLATELALMIHRAHSSVPAG